MRVGNVVTEIAEENEVKRLLKQRRAEIRLKYSLLADEEIEFEIPRYEAELKAAKAALSPGETVAVYDGEFIALEGA